MISTLDRGGEGGCECVNAQIDEGQKIRKSTLLKITRRSEGLNKFCPRL